MFPKFALASGAEWAPASDLASDLAAAVGVGLWRRALASVVGVGPGPGVGHGDCLGDGAIVGLGGALRDAFYDCRRLVRLFRVLKLGRYSAGMQLMFVALKNSSQARSACFGHESVHTLARASSKMY